LNGRIYYEIKRRYKNVLLQRHSTNLNESITSHRGASSRRNSRLALPGHTCEHDRPICAATVHLTDNESITMTTLSPIHRKGTPAGLRINFKERQNRPSMPVALSDNRQPVLKRTYSFLEKQHCNQVRLIRVGYRTIELFVERINLACL
jgi:hypothetical protein